MEQLNPILPDINEVEEWRVCAEYPAYSVSSFGRVKNNKNNINKWFKCCDKIIYAKRFKWSNKIRKPKRFKSGNKIK